MSIVFNMKRAAAESYFSLGRIEEGEKAFEALTKEFPDEAWGYVGWGDMYAAFGLNNGAHLDYEKARALYERALKVPNPDPDIPIVVQERLEDLEAGESDN